MPYNLYLSGDPNIPTNEKLNEVDNRRALRLLEELSGHVKGKSGVLRLMHANEPDRFMTFERKSWYQFCSRLNSQMKEETAVYLKGLFAKALNLSLASETERGEFLSEIDEYLKSRNGQFGTKSLVRFVARMQELRIYSTPSVPEWEEVYERKLGSSNDIFPSEIFEGMKLEARELGSGAQGKAYVIGGRRSGLKGRGQDRVLKVENSTQYTRIDPGQQNKNNPFPFYRRGDVAAGLLVDNPSLVKPEILYLAVKKDDGEPEFWSVPVRRVKRFVKELADPKNGKVEVALIGQIMPMAKGVTVDKIRWGIPDNEGTDPKGKPRAVARGLIKALTDLGSNRIVHHDIKPDNLIFDETTEKLTVIDSGLVFKLSKNQNEKKDKGNLTKSILFGGTAGYMAPQLYAATPHGPEVDFFSAACVTLTLTEPLFYQVLKSVDTQVKNEKIMPLPLDQPEKYLDCLLEMGKKFAFGNKSFEQNVRNSSLRLEEKLNNNLEFKNFIVDCFIYSSGREPEAGEARERLVHSPYLQGEQN